MASLPWVTERGVNPVLDRWLSSSWVRPCLCLDEVLQGSAGVFASIPEDVDPPIVATLRRRGITRLFAHQRRAIDAALAGRHVVIATPTASGKSLCFHVPVLQALRKASGARALYLYPTKALARDQETGLRDLMAGAGIDAGAVVYDGDTPADARRAARERAAVIVTNPDMLHSGILPHHTSWARTLQNLRFVVIDELHTYNGVFGSHVANVLRRLMRVAKFHGSTPQILGATATIGNPREHAARLYGVCDEDLEVIEENSAPRGRRRFFLFNPPVVNQELGIRASYIKQAVMLASDLVAARVPTIVFGQSRNSVEVMLRYLRDAVATTPRRTDRGGGIDPRAIVAYRAGYLPGQRREIERRLRDGDVLCVVATSALELGIDIGEIDAVVCAGYPGSVAGTWQRFGRAGRRRHESICVLVASSAPVDQYLAREPTFLVNASVEQARIDPDNVEILVQHVKCAAFELPFRRGEAFGTLGVEGTADTLSFLSRHRVLHESADRYHWATDAFPANDVSLRSVGWDNVVIIDVAADRSIGELDWRATHTMLHEQAIYQHDGECWQVERLDYENHKAFVRKVEPDYWTDAMTHVEVSVIEEAATGPAVADDAGSWQTGWGEVAVVERVVGYKKIKFHTHENAGYGEVRLPDMQMHTTAFWFSVPQRDCHRVTGGRAAAIDALRGAGRALRAVAALAFMCEPRDFGTTLGDAAPTDQDAVGPAGAETVRPKSEYDPTLFVYEQVPGGTGLAERMWQQRGVLLAKTFRMIQGCPCATGCPSCVGPGGTDHKSAALELLGVLASA